MVKDKLEECLCMEGKLESVFAASQERQRVEDFANNLSSGAESEGKYNTGK